MSCRWTPATDRCFGAAVGGRVISYQSGGHQRVAAAVVRSDETLSSLALRTYLSERLVDYQRPSEIFFVTALPRNAMGKVMRRELREQLPDH